MKRILTTILVLLPALVYSQNIYDGLRFSQRFYDGTARSIAMGNAFTALGGDLGAININPAAGGVYRYSELVFSPILHFNMDQTKYLGNKTSNTRTGFNVSNFGYIGAFSTGNSYGLKSFNFSVTYNQTNNFNARTSASGVNAKNSWAASLAASMNGTISGSLDMYEEDPYYPFYNSSNSWDAILGWNTYLIDNYPKGSTNYIGATENLNQDGTTVLGGNLNQNYYRQITGFNSDIAFNFSGNVSDKFFFGLNLTVTDLYYSSYERYSESSEDPAKFDTGFKNFAHSYRQSSSGVGFNVKAGIIYLPVAGLRLGASVSTPTWMYMKDEWYSRLQTSFSDKTKDSDIESPVGMYQYRINTPFVWNLGAAYTFGNIALISIDYENTNYSYLRMADYDGSRDLFRADNKYASESFQMVHNVRVGTEIKVLPFLAIRAGYNYYSSPEKGFDSDLHLASIGIGYRTRNGFFMDLAYQQQCNYNKEVYALYDGYTGSGEIPTIDNKYMNSKLVLSIGIRF